MFEAGRRQGIAEAIAAILGAGPAEVADTLRTRNL